MGAVVGGGIGILFYDTSGFWILPLMIIGGAIGGALWGLIPAILKVKFNTRSSYWISRDKNIGSMKKQF